MVMDGAWLHGLECLGRGGLPAAQAPGYIFSEFSYHSKTQIIIFVV